MDLINKQLVGVQGDAIVVFVPASRMSKSEALTHAAYLVALADDHAGQDNSGFSKVLAAVLSL